MTFPLPLSTAVVDEFVLDLRAACRVWFNKMFREMLVNPPVKLEDGVNQKSPGAIKEWRDLSEAARESYIQKADLSTDAGMLAVFAGGLAEQPWAASMPGLPFYTRAAAFAKMGGCGMSMGRMERAWTLKGFGFWAHIAPDIGLRLVLAVVPEMEKMGFSPVLSGSVPHPIYKPPGGLPLGVHHDQQSPRELIANLRRHVASTDASTTAWVQMYGCQMLAHLRGGTREKDGATFTIGPMTPAKLLCCLEAYAAGKVDGDWQKWIEKPSGKCDLDWQKHLGAFNEILLAAGYLEPIGKLNAAPGVDDDYGTGHVLMFPVGWPHGSHSNAAALDAARITITLPVSLKTQAKGPPAYERIAMRLRDMALISEESFGLDDPAVEAAMVRLALDTKPYADGPTHKKPEAIVRLVGGPDGPFRKISVRSETVEKFLRAMQAQAQPQAQPPARNPFSSVEEFSRASQAQTPLQPPAPRRPPSLLYPILARSLHVPPSKDVLNDNTRLLKVKQPWADALVRGLKDCENRTKPLAMGEDPVWVLVVSSMSDPTKKEMQELHKKLEAAKLGAARAFHKIEERKEYTKGHIVGMIKVVGCYRERQLPWPTAWHNPPDWAWMIADAWMFDEPLKLDDDDHFQTQVRLGQRKQYIGPLHAQVDLLQEGPR